MTRIPYTLVVSVSGRVERGPSYAASQLPLPSGSASAVAGSTDRGGLSVWALAGIAVAAALALLLIGLLVRRRGAQSGPRHSGLTTTVGPVRTDGAVPANAPPNSAWPPPSALPPPGVGPPPP
jgi:hypothetical protein